MPTGSSPAFPMAPPPDIASPQGVVTASVLILGAGLAGLAATRQLLYFSLCVLVLEGRVRPGGRVNTTRLDEDATAAADHGGSSARREREREK
jgi:[histone H3]-N6,N6-dimethyl-L-lysine4 FAD-dependent demethylase